MDDQFKICRLCLKLIIKKDYKSMKDELVMVTAIFLDLVHWKYSENPLLCYECVENLQKSYNFKSTCLMSEKQIYSASGCKQDDVDLWQIRNESESEEFKQNKKICRFCLSLNQKDEYVQLEEKDGIHLMLQKCLPELDLFMVREPVICQNCFDALKSLFNFIVSCLNVEESINMYRDTEGTGSNEKVNLYNVLQFTKIQKSDVDDVYIQECVNANEIETVVKFENSADENFEEEPEVFLKTEPLEFEEESETSVKIEHVENQTEIEGLRRKLKKQLNSRRNSDSSEYDANMKDYFASAKPSSLVTSAKVFPSTQGEEPEDGVILKQLELTTSLGMTQKCLMSNLEEDQSKPCENISTEPTYRCECCSFRTVYKDNLQMQTSPSEVTTLKCDSCSCQKKYEDNLKRHLLKHKDPLEVTMFKCDFCLFQTKRRADLKRHLLSHKDRTEVTMYQCKCCSYQTDSRYCLKTHSLQHKEPSEVTMFKCDSCSFQTKYERSLKTHSVVHKDPSKVTKYKCDYCSFQTKYRDNLRKHLLSHKEPSEGKVFKCDSCSYQTNHKDSIKKHFLTHKGPSEVTMFKCDSCPFQTKHKCSLKIHALQHKEPTEIAMFKCDSCSFQTYHKSSIKKHLLKHKEPSEVTMFKCNFCSFETKYGASLKSHLVVHAPQARMYKCDSCPYQTKHKGCLKTHFLRLHTDPSEIIM